MKRTRYWAWILPCFAAAPAWGAVGELKPVAVDLQASAAAGFRPRSVYTRSLTAAPPGCGTVHPQAKVATLTTGSRKIAVALDSAKADAKALDLVRFDFTGKGRFQGAETLPLKPGRVPSNTRSSGLVARGTYFHFGPATLNVPRGGSTFPVTVTGQYFAGTQRSSSRYVLLRLLAAAEGSCRFGDKTYGLRVVDGTGDLRFGDGTGLSQKDGTVIRPAGSSGLITDTMLIDTASERFQTARLKVRCGELVSVDGTLYRVSFDADGTKVAATPSDVKLGKVVVPGDTWSVTLVGTKHVLALSGGPEPVEVPADRYVAANYRATTDSGTPNKPHRFRSGYYVLLGREPGKVFDVKPGEVTKVPVGSPLTTAVTVAKSGQTVRLNAIIRDAAGSRVSSLYGPKGRPPAPKVTIYNDKRERVYQTSLKYG